MKYIELDKETEQALIDVMDWSLGEARLKGIKAVNHLINSIKIKETKVEEVNG